MQLIPILLSSLSGKTEYINDDIIILEWIFLTEITIIFAVPEAARTHVKSTITLLQNYHVGCEFQILVNFLEQFDDDLTGIIAPLLCFL